MLSNLYPLTYFKYKTPTPTCVSITRQSPASFCACVRRGVGLVWWAKNARTAAGTSRPVVRCEVDTTVTELRSLLSVRTSSDNRANWAPSRLSGESVLALSQRRKGT